MPASFERLQSLHIEQFSDKTPARLSYDVDDAGRCSGEIVQGGRHISFVTTRDGRLLSSADGSAAGGWVEVADGTLGQLCLLGPIGPALSPAGSVDRWVVDGATRVGPERVDGRATVHFRKSIRDGSIDTWLASEGPKLRLIKLVRRSADGETVTSQFSEFDSASPVEPEPPADQIAKPDASTT